ncbi:glutathione S-transferase Mu 1-like protein, partial [Dinothrombium tinctorium]
YAQPIRLLLAYTETDFVDRLYNVGPPPTFDKSEWFNEKFKLGLDFPNLPYYFDDNVKLSQTLAILRYLAMKNDLEGKDMNEKIRIALIEQQLVDYRNAWSFLCYDSEFEKIKPEYIASLPEKMKAISNFLADNEWFAGKHLSYVDFLAYELFDVHNYLLPNYLDEYPNLKQFVKRVESLPTIEKYMKSDRFIKYPLNNDQAQFGARHQS